LRTGRRKEERKKDALREREMTSGWGHQGAISHHYKLGNIKERARDGRKERVFQDGGGNGREINPLLVLQIHS